MNDFESALIAAFAVALVVIGVATSPKQACEPPSVSIAEETVAPIEEAPVEEKTPVALYDVPLATEVQLHIINEAESHGIDPAIIFAMAFRESTYNPAAIGDNGNSLGLLQIQPRWNRDRMERLGVTDLLDPYQNVTVAVDLLSELLDRYGSIEKAVTAYNQGHWNGTVTKYAKAVLETAEELRGEVNEGS